ncbi:MAG: SRPBCC family protein [Nocardioidaceae bacterium]
MTGGAILVTMPGFSHTLEVAAPPGRVFAILDDVGRTPEWLSRCSGVEKLDAGPNTVGTRLLYLHGEGRRIGQMDGRITAYEPDEHMAMVYTDRMMEVGVDFVVRPGASESSTSLTHTLDIGTKGVGRLFTPFISRRLPHQTVEAMQRLKGIAEGEAQAH